MLQLKANDDTSKKWLDVLRANAERGGNMVRQVLSFARGVEGERIALQPTHLIKEIVKILRETLPKSIEINFQLPDDLWIISAEAGLRNLVRRDEIRLRAFLCCHLASWLPECSLYTAFDQLRVPFTN